VTVGPKAAGSGAEGSRSVAIQGHSTALQQALANVKASGPVLAQNGPGLAGLPRMITNTVGMSFGIVPPGRFQMGSPETEPGRRDHEGPQHEVVLKKPYYIGVHPVTQIQYERVMGRNPSTYTKAHSGGPEHPVENVTYGEAVRFCEFLGKQHDEQLNGRHYSLPTEAEWEYACRAGSTAAYICGEKLSAKEAQFASPGAYTKGGGKAQTAPVGRCTANAFGLYDLHGNVLEWVSDYYDEFYYHDTGKDHPEGPTEGTLRVVRGGCYQMFAIDCRSAARRSQAPTTTNSMTGFRVVLLVGGS